MDVVILDFHITLISLLAKLLYLPSPQSLNISMIIYISYLSHASYFLLSIYLIIYLSRLEAHEESTSQAPVFTSSPKSIEVMEGQKAHFEARIIPVSDPTLKVEWFLNGQPIRQGINVFFFHFCPNKC